MSATKTHPSLEVWLDSNLAPACRVGTLTNDRGQVRFSYDKAWLRGGAAFALDPDLSLDESPFFPRHRSTNFGIFLDSAPDRWGQTLMKRREAIQARDEKRQARALHSWDFLIGVQDLTRQGALRFRLEGTEGFLGAEKHAAPPVTSLRELEAVALQLTNKRLEDLDALRQWLAVLVAPGASLGGARPKANFTESDGSLWIAKFPAMDDNRDIGLWEHVLHSLAKDAGITLPEVRLARFNHAFHTLCSRRFDRIDGQRRFYASAFTVLRKEDNSDDSSYLEIAQFIQNSGDPFRRRDDLCELFRRVAFNVAVGNRDDHLRNHGFILAEGGWQLAPAFDVNPNVDQAEHVLSIDDVDKRPDLLTVLATAPFYGLTTVQGLEVIEKVAAAVDGWREEAARQGVPPADIELTAAAFSAHTAFRLLPPEAWAVRAPATPGRRARKFRG